MILSHREVFMGAETLLPELALLGQSHNSRARVPGLAPHIHPSACEIFYISRGDVEWWTNDESHNVSAGQIYINRPGERHGSVGCAIRPCSYLWIQIRTGSRSLPGLSVAETRGVLRVLSNESSRCFAVRPEVEQYFQLMLVEARQPKPLSRMLMRANLHLLLGQIVRDAQHLTGQTHTPAVRKALQLIEDNLEAELQPQFLAEQAGMSLGHFRERFRSETGFTPHAYVTRQRIEAAKAKIRSGVWTSGEISRRFGFCSSQHFATVFKKLEGMSPSEFAQSQVGDR